MTMSMPDPMSLPVTSGFRLAVLRLAAAHPDDRAWILSRMPEAGLRKVTQLLAEIEGLGISNLHAWIDELSARLPATLTPAADSPVDENRARWALHLLASIEAHEIPLSLDERLHLEDLAGGKTTDEAPVLPPALVHALKEVLAVHSQASTFRHASAVSVTGSAIP